MGMSVEDLKYAQRERLIYLDRCFTWRGSANRRDLVEKFGISTAQAALDFNTYLNIVQRNAPTYDLGRKAYFSSENHKPVFGANIKDAFEVLVEGKNNFSLSHIPTPERTATPRIITNLYQALQAKSELFIRYTSMTSGADSGQWIAPTQFSFDGESVHLRAFSFKHLEYRDYLPMRISLDSSFEQKLRRPIPEDTDWLTLGRYWLRPKSNMTSKQASVVRLEYGFTGTTLVLETRKALEIYLFRRWRLGEANSRLEIAKTEYSELAT